MIVEVAIVVLEVVWPIVVEVVGITIVVVIPVIVTVAIVIVLIGIALYGAREGECEVSRHARDGCGEIKLLRLCAMAVGKVEMASMAPIAGTFAWKKGGRIRVFLKIGDELIPLDVLCKRTKTLAFFAGINEM